MKTNQQRWKEEFDNKGIPSSFKETPSEPVVNFVKALRGQGIVGGFALDLGCGRGRNSLHLLGAGYHVTSFDLVSENISELRRAAGGTGSLVATVQDLSQPWALDADSVDLAIDTFCFKHLVDLSDRENYLTELKRVLKSGGHFLLTLASVDDGYYSLFLDPTERTNREITDPENGIESMLYSKEDVEKLFANDFELADYENKKKSGTMHGKTYTRSTHIFHWKKR